MKAREVIDAAMSDWHAVDAARMADETFGQLDDAEVQRFALRAYTDEWRASLRAKDDYGVPRYASIEVQQPDGSVDRVYKQTALFNVEDYEAAISYHRREALSHLHTANSLAKRCNAVHGTDLPLPGMEIPA